MKEGKMFVGAVLTTTATDFFPREHAKGEKWTHWKVRLTRWRYADERGFTVFIQLYFARKEGDRWIVGRKVQVSDAWECGFSTYEAFKLACTLEWDKKKNPQVRDELRRALKNFREKFEELRRKEAGLSLHVLKTEIKNVSVRSPS